ncbi:hypothetical protein [Alicyclobacillus mengziensis]|nr:hypothetical protein [Alicyclobacillus mengziensis]
MAKNMLPEMDTDLVIMLRTTEITITQMEQTLGETRQMCLKS